MEKVRVASPYAPQLTAIAVAQLINVMKNILIGTNEFGKIWYGDIEGDSDYILGLCRVMSQRVGQSVTVVHESF